MSRGRRLAAGWLVVAGVALAALPAFGLPAFYESFLYLVFNWIALATSWSLLSGYAGYFSFGHGAFFGAGMYTTTTLAAGYGMPFLATLPVAAAVAALLSAGIGIVVFRLRRLRGEHDVLETLPGAKLVGTVGPGFTITLEKSGSKVTKLKAGKYTIVVRDLSSSHNFHLSGPGVNKKTSVGGTGTSIGAAMLARLPREKIPVGVAGQPRADLALMRYARDWNEAAQVAWSLSSP